MQAGAVLAAVWMQRPEEDGVAARGLDGVAPVFNNRCHAQPAGRPSGQIMLNRCSKSTAQSAVDGRTLKGKPSRHATTMGQTQQATHFLAQADQPFPRTCGRPSGNTVSPPSSGVVLQHTQPQGMITNYLAHLGRPRRGK